MARSRVTLLVARGLAIVGLVAFSGFVLWVFLRPLSVLDVGITGLRDACGATVYCDGKSVGRLEPYVSEFTVIADSAGQIAPELGGRAGDTLIAIGDTAAMATVRISIGDHILTIERTDGRRVSRRVFIEGSAPEFDVSFKAGRIRDRDHDPPIPRR